MSNPVSLYVAPEVDMITELSDQAVVGGEREPEFRDYLEQANSDLYTFELSGLYRAKGSALKYQPADRIINIILWSWIDSAFKICDVDPELADGLGLDLVIGFKSLQDLQAAIHGFNPESVAFTLFDQNEVWAKEQELRSYLTSWHQAFLDALSEGKGLYYKIWV